jgi:hypothetical protein
MRTNPILTVTAIVIAGLGAAYYFLPDHALLRPVEAAKPALSSTASLTGKNPPLRDERRDHPATPEQQQLTRLHEKIAALEARLRSLEATTSAHATDPTGSRSDAPEADKDAEKAKAKKFSEDDFGQWLDAALDTGDFDRDAARVTREEMAPSLAAVPGLNLADLQCGDRFCRASFVSANGEPPNLAHLIGASPFIESGFTLTAPDGGVRVYFTQPGQSLGELRSEARESTLRDMHSQ